MIELFYINREGTSAALDSAPFTVKGPRVDRAKVCRFSVRETRVAIDIPLNKSQYHGSSRSVQEQHVIRLIDDYDNDSALSKPRSAHTDDAPFYRNYWLEQEIFTRTYYYLSPWARGRCAKQYLSGILVTKREGIQGSLLNPKNFEGVVADFLMDRLGRQVFWQGKRSLSNRPSYYGPYHWRVLADAGVPAVAFDMHRFPDPSPRAVKMRFACFAIDTKHLLCLQFDDNVSPYDNKETLRRVIDAVNAYSTQVIDAVRIHLPDDLKSAYKQACESGAPISEQLQPFDFEKMLKEDWAYHAKHQRR